MVRRGLSVAVNEAVPSVSSHSKGPPE